MAIPCYRPQERNWNKILICKPIPLAETPHHDGVSTFHNTLHSIISTCLIPTSLISLKSPRKVRDVGASILRNHAPPAMKHGFPLLPVLLLAASASSHAFSLDIASTEVTKFGQGPRSIFVPGYGEVAFESGLDGALVVDSAYASTGKIDLPPVATSASEPPVTATEDTGYVEIASRSTASATDQPAPGAAPLQRWRNRRKE